VTHDTTLTQTGLAVEVRGLTKTFGEGAIAWQALRGVDLDVQRREFLMMVGPSGSGKTTLLSILGCVLTATTGSAKLFGQEITTLPARQLPRLRLGTIGFIFGLVEGGARGPSELKAGVETPVYQLKPLWQDLFPVEWQRIQDAHKTLAARLADGVYAHGFLRR
jgi:ABC-type phosphate/phosphonate transport system ATPase subunit